MYAAGFVHHGLVGMTEKYGFTVFFHGFIHKRVEMIFYVLHMTMDEKDVAEFRLYYFKIAV